ncbi:hypothetical protein [Streptomyces sp. BK022]|uniref:hypothetical protein n=1 Tax=Streptomyces sp. BK022 TaxID=2512123 RepID=UPI001029C946|nr:hypothetical protein [Streptomyces sp. BK022]
MRLPQQDKTYFPIDEISATTSGLVNYPDLRDLLDGVDHLSHRPVVEGPQNQVECPECHRRETDTDYYISQQQLVIDLRCHGFIVVNPPRPAEGTA